MHVRALELTMQERGTSITARAVVATDSGDARGVRVEVMLPVGVGVITVPDGCRPSPSPVMSPSAAFHDRRPDSATFGIAERDL